jgi:hypothetical protein
MMSWGVFPDGMKGIGYCLSLRLSYFATDSQSVIQSVRLGIEPLSSAHDQILTVVRQLQDDVMGRLPWRDDGPVL